LKAEFIVKNRDLAGEYRSPVRLLFQVDDDLTIMVEDFISWKIKKTPAVEVYAEQMK
jgi:hypothetical protein